METFRMIFLLYTGLTPPVLIASFLCLLNFLMALCNKQKTKRKLTQNISHLQEWHQYIQNGQSLSL